MEFSIFFSITDIWESWPEYYLLFEFNVSRLLCFLGAYWEFPHNLPHKYSAGTVMIQFSVISCYFLYYFAVKVRKIFQKCYHNDHSDFIFHLVLSKSTRTTDNCMILYHCIICTKSTQNANHLWYICKRVTMSPVFKLWNWNLFHWVIY